MEFYDVNFSYIDLENSNEIRVKVPESSVNNLIPEEILPNGSLYTVATNSDTSHKGLFRLDIQTMAGSGKLDSAGFGNSSDTKDEIKEAINYIQANLHRVSINAKYKENDYYLKVTDLNGIGKSKSISLAILISICSGILERPILSQTVILGSFSIGGIIIGTESLDLLRN
jgi:ATP-dependent Lon protease